MGLFIIREYDKLAVDANGHEIPVGLEPALATQVVATSGTSASSAVFNVKTRYILIMGSGIMNYLVAAAGPAVIQLAGRLPADVFLFMGVASGGKNDAGVRTPLLISVIDDL